MTTHRAYRFRFYPTAAQRRLLARDLGAARWVWNAGLSWRGDAWRADRARVTGVDFSRELTWLKRLEPYAWLAEVNSTVLTQKLRDLDAAFAAFFAKRARYPRFKRRSSAQAVRYQLDQRRLPAIYEPGARLVLPKIGAIKVRWSRLPVGAPRMATVTRDAAGRWFVALGVEESIAALPATGAAVGVDLGVKDLYVTSDGQRSGNPRKLRARLRHLRRLSRSVSRKRKGSERWRRANTRLARLHAKIADSRRDWLQKHSTALIRQADVIAIEDLNVRGMLKNRRLSRSIADASWGALRQMIEYKAAWHGKQVLYADRFAPTSKTCGACGHRLEHLALHQRRWSCPACGADHDRDLNAAHNILVFATGGRPGSGHKALSAWTGKDPGGKAAPAALAPARGETRTENGSKPTLHGAG